MRLNGKYPFENDKTRTKPRLVIKKIDDFQEHAI